MKNIKSSLHRIANYIKNRHLKNNRKEDVPSFLEFGQAAWTLISAIYSSSWDALKMDDSNKSFHNKVSEQFSKKIIVNTFNKKSEKIPTSKPIDFLNIPPSLVSSRPSKEELNKLKHHSKSQKYPRTILINIPMLKHYLGILKIFSKSKIAFLIFQTRKLRIFTRPSMIQESQNLIST